MSLCWCQRNRIIVRCPLVWFGLFASIMNCKLVYLITDKPSWSGWNRISIDLVAGEQSKCDIMSSVVLKTCYPLNFDSFMLMQILFHVNACSCLRPWSMVYIIRCSEQLYFRVNFLKYSSRRKLQCYKCALLLALSDFSNCKDIVRLAQIIR